METIMHLKVPPATMFAALLKRNVGQSKHLITMHTSPKMFDRLYAAEGGSRKEARFLYWPGGRSGVTIGAGYDMSGRPESAIVKDLTAIGVDAVTAGKVAKCAGASGQTGVNTATRVINAKQFVDDNKNLLDLSPDRQKALFLRILPQYEGHVRSAVHVPLLQNEFDALVSFDYNCPAGMAAIGPKINNGEITKALQSMEQYLVHGMKYQDDRPRLALAGRRHHEVTYYLTGEF
jgi:GH24 family phage-related lysozyme (muramidase)